MTAEREDGGIIVWDGERYLSQDAAAAHLAVVKQSIYNYIRKYHLTKYKFVLGGNRVFLKQSELDAAVRGGPIVVKPQPRQERESA